MTAQELRTKILQFEGDYISFSQLVDFLKEHGLEVDDEECCAP